MTQNDLEIFAIIVLGIAPLFLVCMIIIAYTDRQDIKELEKEIKKLKNGLKK